MSYYLLGRDVKTNSFHNVNNNDIINYNRLNEESVPADQHVSKTLKLCPRTVLVESVQVLWCPGVV